VFVLVYCFQGIKESKRLPNEYIYISVKNLTTNMIIHFLQNRKISVTYNYINEKLLYMIIANNAYFNYIGEKTCWISNSE